MKKFLSMALAMIMILATLTVMLTINGFATDDEGVITPDKSWYDASKTEYELADAADLMGFILLLEGEKTGDGTVVAEPVTFVGKTIKLTANIDVNPGWNAAQYYAEITATGEGADMIIPEVPVNEWTIHGGTNATDAVFGGTFDGQNHYISGIFWDNFARGSGLFGRVSSGVSATIKNVAFVNSYVCLNEWRQGAIIGAVSSGCTLTMENVYSEIIVHTTRSSSNETGTDLGGFCGTIFGGPVNFTKCVNAGIMSGPNGGLSGFCSYTDTTTCTVNFEDCLVSGQIKGPESQKKVFNANGEVTGLGHVAGFIVKNKGNLNMKTCVMAAEINDYGYVFTYDNRTTSTFTLESLLYVGNYERVDGVVTNAGADDNKVVDTKATKVTLDHLKSLRGNGYDDWTSTVEDGGIKMPISEALAATVKAYIPPVIDENDPTEDTTGNDTQDTTGNDAQDTTGGNTNETTANTNESTDNKTTEANKGAADTDAAAKKGCGGIIGAGAITIVAVTGAALVIAKKKEN